MSIIEVILRGLLCYFPIVTIMFISKHDCDIVEFNGQQTPISTLLQPNTKTIYLLFTYMMLNNIVGVFTGKLSVCETIALSYMCIMAYTDEKSYQLYDMLSYITLGFAAFYLVCKLASKEPVLGLNSNSLLLLIPIAVMIVSSAFNSMGFGDILMITALSSLYVVEYDNPVVMMCITLIIGAIVFILLSLLKRKGLKDKAPFAMSLAIAHLCIIYFA